MSEDNLERVVGGRVVGCSDEGFAPAENLLATRAPEFRFGIFLPGKGQEFDSWETRRHNAEAPDWVVLELGTPGPIGTVDIDTHWHDGNHAERGAVLALVGTRGESPRRDDPRWTVILPASPLDGHAHNVFRTPRGEGSAWSHVLLESHPDGGIARLRCYPAAAPADVDPGAATERRVRHEAAIPRGGDRAHQAPTPASVAQRWESCGPDELVDLACEAFGGRVVATSNNRYGHSQALLAEAAPTSMGDGWETSRSRAADHFDHVVVALGRRGRPTRIVVDFTYFPLNNPVDLRLQATDAPGHDVPPDDSSWFDLVPRTRVKQLAGDVLTVELEASLAGRAVTHVRLESYPDGGANRLRVFGRPA
jgi:allantoicase